MQGRITKSPGAYPPASKPDLIFSGQGGAVDFQNIGKGGLWWKK